MKEEIVDLIDEVASIIESEKIEDLRKLNELPYEMYRIIKELQSELPELKNLLENKPRDVELPSSLISSVDELANALESVEFVNDIDGILNLMDSQIMQILGNIVDGINTLVNNLQTKITTLGATLRRYKLNARFHDKTKLITATLKELNPYLKIVREEREKLLKMHDGLFNIYNQALLAVDTQELEHYSDRTITIADRLYDTGGVWVTDILNIFSGLESITAQPVSELINIDLPNKEEEHETNIQSLFFRYPPFRPILVPDTQDKVFRDIFGSYIWFIKPKNGYIKWVKPRGDNYIIKGTSEVSPSGKYISIKNIEPINTLRTKKGFVEVVLEIPSKNRHRKIVLRYGSDKLKLSLENGKTPQQIKSQYRQTLQKRNRSSYDPTNLSYIWYCTRGFGFSTNPWDIQCPFKKECPLGKSCNGKSWSWNRRIHPKVFPKIEREFIGIPNSTKVGLISPIVQRRVNVQELYTAVQFTMPYSHFPVNIEFEKPVGRILPETNVIGFEIPVDLLNMIILSIMDENANKDQLGLDMEFELWKGGPKVRISDVLISKYYFYTKGDRGFNIYDMAEQSQDKLLKDYHEFRENLRRDLIHAWKNPTNTALEFIKWAQETLLHTLAHLFMAYVSKELQVESSELLYMYKVDKKRALILVAENSPIGAIDIVSALENWGTPDKFIEKFLEDTVSLFSEHEKDIKDYLELSKGPINDSEKKKVIEKLKNLYEEYVDNGLILDLHTFSVHLLLSGIFESFIQTSPNRDLLWHSFDDLLTIAIPNYCIDGCTSCVMLTKGCQHGIGQPFITSKLLVKVFLDIVAKKREFQGPGNVVLKTLIGQLTKRKLVALSPFIDEEGVKFLKNLKSAGVDITIELLNTKENRNFLEDLERTGIKVILRNKVHRKAYIVDDTLVINTSTNLNLRSESYNSFSLRRLTI